MFLPFIFDLAFSFKERGPEENRRDGNYIYSQKTRILVRVSSHPLS